MKIKATSFEILNGINGTKLLLEVDKGSFKAVMKMQENKTLSGDLEVKVEKYREKRSLNHNKLFWDMCNYLAEHINEITATEIYKQLIRDFGIATIIPIADDILEMTINAWQEKGEGWQTEMLRKSKLDGNYTNVKFWFGSSVYNSKQFYKLVEGLKQECLQYDLDISFYDKQMQSAMEELKKKESAYEIKTNKSR